MTTLTHIMEYDMLHDLDIWYSVRCYANIITYSFHVIALYFHVWSVMNPFMFDFSEMKDNFLYELSPIDSGFGNSGKSSAYIQLHDILISSSRLSHITPRTRFVSISDYFKLSYTNHFSVKKIFSKWYFNDVPGYWLLTSIEYNWIGWHCKDWTCIWYRLQNFGKEYFLPNPRHLMRCVAGYIRLSVTLLSSSSHDRQRSFRLQRRKSQK